MSCSARGMLLIGKMNPDSMIVGRNEISSASWNASCWVSATVEISSPVAERADQEQRERDEQRQPVAAHRQAEQEHRRADDERRRRERDEEVRKRLADDERQRVDRRHAHLLHRAGLLLADDRQRGRGDSRDHRDVGDQPGTRNSVLRSSGLYQMRGSTRERRLPTVRPPAAALHAATSRRMLAAHSRARSSRCWRCRR